MRIIAILFVIFNHTNTMGFVRFATRNPGSISFWLNLGNAVFCKFNVPLFFIISGALMLGKPQERIKDLFKKRIMKYIVILIVFSAFYAISNTILCGYQYTLESFLQTLYSSNIKYHLSFLYSYIAFLIMLPLLKAFCEEMQDKHFVYLIIICGITKLLPIIQYLLWKGKVSINSTIIPSLPLYALVLPLIGYFLEQRVQIQQIKRWLWPIWLINVLCIALCCYTTFVKGVDTGVFSESDSQTFFGNFAFINSIAIYCTIKVLFSRINLNNHIEKYLIMFGSTCFGVYLLHPFFKDMPYMKPFVQLLNSSSLPDICVTWIYVLSMFVPSVILTLLIRKCSKLL